MNNRPRFRNPRSPATCWATAGAFCVLVHASVWASDPPAASSKKMAADISTTSAANPKEVGEQVREALGTSVAPNKRLNVIVAGKSGVASSALAAQPSRQYVEARAKALGLTKEAGKVPEQVVHGGEVHWAYEGNAGPQAWGKLKMDFSACAVGKRQSPINIEDGATLQGPAEPIQFSYLPSNASVVNNGHTIQVDVLGENSITVRGSNYRLLQFHFHTPSEEQINFKRYPMVAHLVHKNAEGQLAVVAVLLEQGSANALIDRVWTYMPLDANDRVRMPADALNLADLLPKDQRYYQFMGSLTTPPCTEGVLWLVMKQPVPISKAQMRLFQQLYPNNARPVQPLNGRPVREAL
ncbi:MAG: carbonic anhydrase family protein [Rhodoferax sp.]|nr:carbonic anhydrase family protein [Rhodoferax sp.]